MQFDQKNTGLIIQDFELSANKDQMSEEEFWPFWQKDGVYDRIPDGVST
ncbi:MAG: hypothetical protein R2784_10450 [Saprospiraceae bacterium]